MIRTNRGNAASQILPVRSFRSPAPLAARLNRRDLTYEFWRYTSGRSADDHYENGHGQVLRLKDKKKLRLDVRSRSSLDVELKPEGE